MKVSIIMLTHNAPKYVKESIETLTNKTKNVQYELIVVDNASGLRTKRVLRDFVNRGMIDTLYCNKKNALFAKGNNIGSELCASDTDLILLLNSDIVINSENWLEKLIEIHPESGGISAFGVVESEPLRADGYCMLIDKKLYDKYKLDEKFEWFWSVTKLESQVLNEGKTVLAIKNHEKYIHHYGGKSGYGFKNAEGMGISIDEVKDWFDKGNVTILENV